MNVDELMKLERPLTDDEAAFMEEEVLKLAKALTDEVANLTRDLDPDDPVVAKLRESPRTIIENIEAAIELREEDDSHERTRIRWLERAKAAAEDPIYDWEKLPVYAWNNQFARVIGMLLAVMPKRLHIHAHNLAGQATLISCCIAMGHRQTEPGEVVPPEELRAYRLIGWRATFTVMEILEDLSRETKYSAQDIAEGMELIGKIREQFAVDLGDVDEPQKAVVLH